jgi:hypothetical protein
VTLTLLEGTRTLTEEITNIGGDRLCNQRNREDDKWTIEVGGH